jgi:hypothetical protein
MPAFSLKWRILKGLPASGRIEGSLFRNLVQNSRNVGGSETPLQVLVESITIIRIAHAFSVPLLEEITVQVRYGGKQSCVSCGASSTGMVSLRSILFEIY